MAATTYAVETAFVTWSVLGVPGLGARRYRVLSERRPGSLVGCYRRTAGHRWALAGALVAVLLLGGTPVAALGFAAPRHLGVAVATAAAAAAIVAGALTTATEPVRRLLRPVRALLPVTTPERWWFTALALTAGVTEEVLYRGVVMLWVRRTVPLSGAAGWAAAVAVSAVLFGLAHVYQGAAGASAAGLAGILLGGLYALTGSLVLPALLHAFADLRTLAATGVRGPGAPPVTSPFTPADDPAYTGPVMGTCTDHAPLSSP